MPIQDLIGLSPNSKYIDKLDKKSFSEQIPNIVDKMVRFQQSKNSDEEIKVEVSNPNCPDAEYVSPFLACSPVHVRR